MSADQQAAYAAAFGAELNRLRDTARHLPLKTRARLDVLLPRLAPTEQRDLVALVILADEEAFGRGVAEVDRQWRQTVAHFPGVLPAIEVVYSHVLHLTPPCSPTYEDCTIKVPDPAA